VIEGGRRRRALVLLLMLSPLAAFCVSVFLGGYRIAPLDVVRMLVSKVLPFVDAGDVGAKETAVLFDVRLPRILLAMGVGCALSVSGVALQAVCRNPLVSPFVLGLSSGAAFGAALALAFLPSGPAVHALAFLFGLLAVAMAYGMARTGGETPALSLVLSGVITGAFFSALLSVLQFLVDPHRLGSIVYWLMGSFRLSDWSRVSVALPLVAVAVLVLYLMRWRLNVVSMGDEEAKSLGLNVEANKFVVVGASTLAAATAVAVCGIVGWIGLMIPHIVRMLVGPDHRLLVPVSAAFGAAFLLSVDDCARCLTEYDLPVGILSTLAGIPFFAWLLKRTKGGGWS